VAPGGMMVLATINRTLKALLLAKIGAEYVLQWLPMGTHDPKKFVKPREVEAALSRGNMAIAARGGVNYNPLSDKWQVTNNTAVNYMIVAKKAKADG
ncbi:MAG: bifunctional 3-demethylubiquinol 3-O-methyltransferase/2-polyprenyl-6-hydroxyphenol methylase, partial [Pseudomonadota bacterium]